MNIVTHMRERLDRLAAWPELDVEAAQLPSRALELSDESVIELLTESTAIANDAARLQAILAGVAAARSRRGAGHGGLAAERGHPSPVALVQQITGGTKADAVRHVRVGESLLERSPDDPPAEADPGVDVAPPCTPTAPPWHHPLRRALLAGSLTPAQHDAIRRGLGEPRLLDGEMTASDAAREVWALAAEQLIDEAHALPVEQLAGRARTVRDCLDPVGAEERFAARFERRSFRMWADADGQHHAHIAFDDEMAAWVRSIVDSAMRPRRGGPRFVTVDEQAMAKALTDDPRTNEQLEYDLLMDLVRAGALASAESVFGARQAGVRLITVKDQTGSRDAFGRMQGTGHFEDGGQAVPGSVIDLALCATGAIEVTVDSCGNPLDVGREQRLFTSNQRIALASRDGGCLWPGCARPASSCESHHIDHWRRDHGRTDVGRGVLLCRFHHMVLHNNGWRIARDGLGPFVLHPPPGKGEPIVLVTKSPLRWAWDPPPDRPHWRAA